MLCRAVQEMMARSDVSERRAVRLLADLIESGKAAPQLLSADVAAYVKQREKSSAEQRQTARIRRLERMMAEWRQGEAEGDPIKYLAPEQRPKIGHDPVHVAAFLRFYCSPSRPTVMDAYKRMGQYLRDQGMEPPSYCVVTRIENSLPVTLKYRGRMTGAAYRSLLPYTGRDVSMFQANDLWVGDGHSFKARIQSPLHGNAFQPEVTVILDWVSRKVVGWSVALSESTIAVSDAFRDAQKKTGARPLVYYSDNGSGQTGKKIDHPIFGSLARQGIAHETGIPGNPQGRGVIERVWSTLFFSLAKSYPTVLTKDADRDHVRKVSQAIAKSQRAEEASPLLPSWSQFLKDIEAAINDYNSNHRHSELGGMTPNEAYAAKLDPDSVYGVNQAEIDELWMPEVERTPQRGLISLFGNQYFSRDLVHVLGEGEKVRVRYDIHDAHQVWLWRSTGEYLGVAEWNGHKRAAFPVAEIELKRDERRRGIVKRAEGQIARAEAEMAVTIEQKPAEEPVRLDLELARATLAERAAATVTPLRQGRPLFETDPEKYRWLMAHKNEWVEWDREWLAEFTRSTLYQNLEPIFAREGIAWAGFFKAAV